MVLCQFFSLLLQRYMLSSPTSKMYLVMWVTLSIKELYHNDIASHFLKDKASF